jgi:hypothetical protein
MQLVLNAAARLVYGLRKFDHVTHCSANSIDIEYLSASRFCLRSWLTVVNTELHHRISPMNFIVLPMLDHATSCVRRPSWYSSFQQLSTIQTVIVPFLLQPHKYGTTSPNSDVTTVTSHLPAAPENGTVLAFYRSRISLIVISSRVIVTQFCIL